MKGKIKNPFLVRWLEGWSFQLVLIGGTVKIEARGFGICLSTSIEPNESPQSAADRLVLSEDQRRKSLQRLWTKGDTMNCLPEVSSSTLKIIECVELESVESK